MRLRPVLQVSRAFRASLDEGGLISVTLEHSDLRDNVTAYAAQLTGEPRAALATFANASGGRVTFRTSLHGAIYSVGLLLQLEGAQRWSPPVHTVTLLTSKITHSLYLTISFTLSITFSLSQSIYLSPGLYLYFSLYFSLSLSISPSHFFYYEPYITHALYLTHSNSLFVSLLQQLSHSFALSHSILIAPSPAHTKFLSVYHILTFFSLSFSLSIYPNHMLLSLNLLLSLSLILPQSLSCTFSLSLILHIALPIMLI